MDTHERETIEQRFGAAVGFIGRYEETLVQLKGRAWTQELTKWITHVNERLEDWDGRVCDLTEEISQSPGASSLPQRC